MSGTHARWLGPILAAFALTAAPGATAARPDAADDATFRPTVLVRKGNAQGSGTLIAGPDGSTFVLTAAHVVAGLGPIKVELHRYNLGVERSEPPEGWPRLIPARVLARDEAGDVAVLMLEGVGELPYVATLADFDLLPRSGAKVTSIGIDQGTKFRGWDAEVKALATMTREGDDSRLFLLTTEAPEHGRSGGGLFDAENRLLGVCVGRIEPQDGAKPVGLFASGLTIRRALKEAIRADVHGGG